ncbi:DUF4349 domain-containing protein [Bacillus solimangrovi]|uniref:DUF4349 domain-containing protein n=1 Tax=Bacillus solimangrovi TaxID=1305675 RepID=A0A1E5LJK7_9BACI|nr:DUF4349 domain-containing protein [Bacillus solimangrovi]OEH94208.1 hypothetical protein BFG57_09150 [Bacillus solimangrovi]
MKKLMLSVMAIWLVACSSNGVEETTESAPVEAESEFSGESLKNMSLENEANISIEQDKVSERMVAYESYVEVSVKDVEDVMESVEETVKESGGYIVESTISTDGNYKRGHLSVRVPSQGFENFLTYVESVSEQVDERNVRGEDVTEEYVDLQSRLKAKRAVEERLLSFMNEAEKTEDLLKISDDLARVQEEIERVEGRVKYLKNNTDYALVNITLRDIKIAIPDVMNTDDLQTGEKIKQAFMSSLNGITAFFSSIVVFLIGFSPIILLVAAIGSVVFIILKKRKGRGKRTSE